jgi:hypothetical protein
MPEWDPSGQPTPLRSISAWPDNLLLLRASVDPTLCLTTSRHAPNSCHNDRRRRAIATARDNAPPRRCVLTEHAASASLLHPSKPWLRTWLEFLVRQLGIIIYSYLGT